MNFYENKLNLYSFQKGDGGSLQQRMISAKKEVDRQNDVRVQSLKCEHRDSFLSPVGFSPYMPRAASMAQYIYAANFHEAVKQQSFVSSMSPEQYFLYMSLKERDDLKEYQTQTEECCSRNFDKLSKYTEREGLGAKLSYLLGRGEDKLDFLLENQRVLDHKSEVLQDSSNAWAEMDKETQIEYLVGRIENQRLSDFDKQGLDNMIQNSFEMKEDIPICFP